MKLAGLLSAELREELLVLECCVDFGVSASVKFPHLKSDLVAFLVVLGRLIPLVQRTDFVVDRRRGIGAGRHLCMNVLSAALYQLRRAHARK
jgi:hypothetical protein